MKKCILLFFALFISGYLVAQDLLGETTSKLVGKPWVFYKQKGQVEEEEEDEPVLYVFRKDSVLVIVDNGVKQHKSWKLEQDPCGMYTFILINEKRFTITFPKNYLMLSDKALTKSTFIHELYFK